MPYQFLILIGLVLLSAFFSATETAYTSLSIFQIHELETKRGKRGKLIKKLTSRPDILLPTVLIGNNLVNISASAMATELTIRLFGNKAIGITTGILTLVILIFGEVTPKRLAIMYNEFMVLHTARFIFALSILFRPFVYVIGGVSSLINKLARGGKRTHISIEGLLQMINLAESMGVLENYETQVVKNVFRFDDITVQAIMTHRMEVFSLDMGLTVDDALEAVNEKGFSRIPVWEEEPENIVGIVLVKDIMKLKPEGRRDVCLKDIMKKPIFVPVSKKVNEVFTQFKREKLDMAIVIDEYGGLAGIVTREDIIGEILGDLYDQHEENGSGKIKELSENEYLIEADISLHQLSDRIGLSLPPGRYAQTLGGFLMGTLGRIPQKEETFTIKQGTFHIESIGKNRIFLVRFTFRKAGEGE
ncbi:MAG: HlyC/CorC family transporter [Spirochaetales bacterium]|nr:MAG: HlyC/CorC family transporter [Spirochaetales bacterium]